MICCEFNYFKAALREIIRIKHEQVSMSYNQILSFNVLQISSCLTYSLRVGVITYPRCDQLLVHSKKLRLRLLQFDLNIQFLRNLAQLQHCFCNSLKLFKIVKHMKHTKIGMLKLSYSKLIRIIILLNSLILKLRFSRYKFKYLF